MADTRLRREQLRHVGALLVFFFATLIAGGARAGRLDDFERDLSILNIKVREEMRGAIREGHDSWEARIEPLNQVMDFLHDAVEEFAHPPVSQTGPQPKPRISGGVALQLQGEIRRIRQENTLPNARETIEVTLAVGLALGGEILPSLPLKLENYAKEYPFLELHAARPEMFIFPTRDWQDFDRLSELLCDETYIVALRDIRHDLSHVKSLLATDQAFKDAITSRIGQPGWEMIEPLLKKDKARAYLSFKRFIRKKGIGWTHPIGYEKFVTASDIAWWHMNHDMANHDLLAKLISVSVWPIDPEARRGFLSAERWARVVGFPRTMIQQLPNYTLRTEVSFESFGLSSWTEVNIVLALVADAYEEWLPQALLRSPVIEALGGLDIETSIKCAVMASTVAVY